MNIHSFFRSLVFLFLISVFFGTPVLAQKTTSPVPTNAAKGVEGNTGIDIGTLRDTLQKADSHLESIRHEYHLFSHDIDQDDKNNRFDTTESRNEINDLIKTLEEIPSHTKTLRTRLGQSKPYAIQELNIFEMKREDTLKEAENLRIALNELDASIKPLTYTGANANTTTNSYDDKTTEYYKAEKELQDAQDDLDDAQEELQDAQDDLDDAQDIVDDRKDELKDAEDDLVDVKEELQDAQDDLKNEQQNEADILALLQNAQKNDQGAVPFYQKSYTNAQILTQNAQDEVYTAQTIIKNHEQYVTNAEKALQQAEAIRDQKKQVRDDAQIVVNQKTKIRDDAQDKVDKAQDERTDAKEKYTTDFDTYKAKLEAYRIQMDRVLLEMNILKSNFDTLEHILRSFRSPPILKGKILPGPKESDMQNDPKRGVDYIAQNLIPAIANWLMVALMGVSVIMIIISGLFFLFTNSDETKEKAKDTLIYVFVGMILAILSFTIVKLLIGFDFTL